MKGLHSEVADVYCEAVVVSGIAEPRGLIIFWVLQLLRCD